GRPTDHCRVPVRGPAHRTPAPSRGGCAGPGSPPTGTGAVRGPGWRVPPATTVVSGPPELKSPEGRNVMDQPLLEFVPEWVPSGDGSNQVEEKGPQEPEPWHHPVPGAVLGQFAGYNAVGEPLVDFPANVRGRPVPARATVALGDVPVGRE